MGVMLDVAIVLALVFPSAGSVRGYLLELLMKMKSVFRPSGMKFTAIVMGLHSSMNLEAFSLLSTIDVPGPMISRFLPSHSRASEST